MDLATLRDALMLQAGYNSALVMIGAALLGLAAGAVGTYVFLRKRALVSDAVAHATLPGIALAFMLMVAMGGDGRDLTGLLAGSALSAALGLLAVDWLTRRTRLTQDAAIGAVHRANHEGRQAAARQGAHAGSILPLQGLLVAAANVARAHGRMVSTA